MTSGKVEISIGDLKFSAEGNEQWLEGQLAKVLEAAVTLVRSSPEKGAAKADVDDVGEGEQFTTSLATHIRDMKADANQTRRFLVTADWLRRRGEKNLNTSMISKALTENHQKRLANASDALNKNVAKGHCEKTKDGFFITPEGLSSLGYR